MTEPDCRYMPLALICASLIVAIPFCILGSYDLVTSGKNQEYFDNHKYTAHVNVSDCRSYIDGHSSYRYYDFIGTYFDILDRNHSINIKHLPVDYDVCANTSIDMYYTDESMDTPVIELKCDNCDNTKGILFLCLAGGFVVTAFCAGCIIELRRRALYESI